jgi:hypothetical protein
LIKQQFKQFRSIIRFSAGSLEKPFVTTDPERTDAALPEAPKLLFCDEAGVEYQARS